MLEVKRVTIKLGQKEYTIQEAAHGRAAPWRRQLVEQVKPIFDQISGISDLEFATPADLLQLWPAFELLFLDGIDKIFNLLIAYSPELEADRAYITDHATERQIFSGFIEVVRLADFFGILPQIQRQAGQVAGGMISQNSQPVNGAAASRKRKR